MIRLFNQDCMTAMKEMPGKAYDLAIVDPPYEDDYTAMRNFNQDFSRNKAIVGKYHFDGLVNHKPSADYFLQLRRVSENQIIFGGNNFIEFLTNTSCFIVWDKDNTGHFADAELAWTSFKTATRIFKYRWNGMLQQDMKNKEYRIHPTQKPVRLYEWLLKNYAKPGDKILDTHLGSGSSAIAADIMGFDFTGYEIDADYFQAAKERLERHQRQCVLGL
jgi:site-specific DNA-methyltransferase (adenine-specific)